LQLFLDGLKNKMELSNYQALRNVTGALILKMCGMLAVILFFHIDLAPDEAQYWTWSQNLDWGYYSKPPGIAWQIAVGTKIFGSNLLGVKCVAMLFSCCLAYAVYFLAKRCGLTNKQCLWAALLMTFSPMGILGSLLVTTDGGLILFWTLASIVLASNTCPNYYLFGLLIAMGALFKWPIYILWIICFFALWIKPSFRSYHAIGGFALSLFGLLPSLFWNVQHDWATFRHVGSTIHTGRGYSLLSGNPLDFIGAQLALFSPICILGVSLAWIRMRKQGKKLSSPVLFCGGISILILAIYIVLSFFKKIQGNWCIFVYPGISVLSAALISHAPRSSSAWVKTACFSSIIALSLAFSIPKLQLATGYPPYKMNPFRHNVGWREMDHSLKELGYKPEKHFLFSDKYQTACELYFYGAEQKRSYFFNLFDSRKNQFSYWPSMPDEQVSASGYYVWVENSDRIQGLDSVLARLEMELSKYFESVQYKGSQKLFRVKGEETKQIMAFECINYLGGSPEETEKY
jgi:hypothetical protein